MIKLEKPEGLSTSKVHIAYITPLWTHSYSLAKLYKVNLHFSCELVSLVLHDEPITHHRPKSHKYNACDTGTLCASILLTLVLSI